MSFLNIEDNILQIENQEDEISKEMSIYENKNSTMNSKRKNSDLKKISNESKKRKLNNEKNDGNTEMEIDDDMSENSNDSVEKINKKKEDYLKRTINKKPKFSVSSNKNGSVVNLSKNFQNNVIDFGNTDSSNIVDFESGVLEPHKENKEQSLDNIFSIFDENDKEIKEYTKKFIPKDADSLIDNDDYFMIYIDNADYLIRILKVLFDFQIKSFSFFPEKGENNNNFLYGFLINSTKNANIQFKLPVKNIFLNKNKKLEHIVQITLENFKNACSSNKTREFYLSLKDNEKLSLSTTSDSKVALGVQEFTTTSNNESINFIKKSIATLNSISLDNTQNYYCNMLTDDLKNYVHNINQNTKGTNNNDTTIDIEFGKCYVALEKDSIESDVEYLYIRFSYISSEGNDIYYYMFSKEVVDSEGKYYVRFNNKKDDNNLVGEIRYKIFFNEKYIMKNLLNFLNAKISDNIVLLLNKSNGTLTIQSEFGGFLTKGYLHLYLTPNVCKENICFNDVEDIE